MVWSLVLVLALATGLASAQDDARCTSTKTSDFTLPAGDQGELMLAASVVFLLLVGITVGTEVTCESLWETIKTERKPFLAGLACQFGFMPLFGLTLSVIMPKSDIFCSKSSFALALLIPGCMPGGTTSNLMTYLIRGNVELSILMSFVSNVCSIFMIPLLLLVYYDARFADDSMKIEVPYASIMGPLAICIIAVGIGIGIKAFASEKVARRVQKLAAIGAVLFLLGNIIALLIELASNPFTLTFSFFASGLLFQPVGYLAGYVLAYYVFQCGLGDSLTISIETGVQNWALPMAIVVAGFDAQQDKRVINDLVVNGAMGPLIFYVLHCSWMLVLYRRIRRRFRGRSVIFDGPVKRNSVGSQRSSVSSQGSITNGPSGETGDTAATVEFSSERSGDGRGSEEKLRDPNGLVGI